METLYRYTGIAIVWAAIAAVCLAVLFLAALFGYRLYRRSWLCATWAVLKACYYFKWTKKMQPSLKGLLAVKQSVENPKDVRFNPWRKWWLRFTLEQIRLYQQRENLQK